MTRTRAIAALFLVAALYDGLLGAAFLIAPGWVYEQAQVTPPNHWGYVQFPAALLLVFACMFVAVAINPIANRNLIIYGFLLKVSYCGLAFWYWFSAGIPGIWKPFAVIDLIMAVLFLVARRALWASDSQRMGKGIGAG